MNYHLLPNDINKEVFKYLDLNSILTFTSTNKEFRRQIKETREGVEYIASRTFNCRIPTHTQHLGKIMADYRQTIVRSNDEIVERVQDFVNRISSIDDRAKLTCSTLGDPIPAERTVRAANVEDHETSIDRQASNRMITLPARVCDIVIEFFGKHSLSMEALSTHALSEYHIKESLFCSHKLGEGKISAPIPLAISPFPQISFDFEAHDDNGPMKGYSTFILKYTPSRFHLTSQFPFIRAREFLPFSLAVRINFPKILADSASTSQLEQTIIMIVKKRIEELGVKATTRDGAKRMAAYFSRGVISFR